MLLSGLNKEQQSAVTCDVSSSVLVLAGAGSGKTRVLTTRVAWLIENNFATLEQILAVTFTNKAAKEMQHRVSEILHVPVSKNLWIGTFHSISLKILGKHSVEANLPKFFQVIDSHDQQNLIRRLLKNLNLEEDNYPPKELQKFINNHKELGMRADGLAPDGMRQQMYVKVYQEYESYCNQEGLVDFTELLLRCYELLSTQKDILNMYRARFRHILIDEFQDTNDLQYRWIKLLAGADNKVFAVGDDDQSIYAFRGAKVSNMQSFIRDFNVGETIRLEQNYRSTPEILSAANAIIANNNGRIGKNLWTNNQASDKLHLYEAYTEEDEAFFVVDEIKNLARQGYDLSRIAILYRSNAQSRVFEQLFYQQGIAYQVYGGLRFFDRQEIKHALAYLRLVVNSSDNEAFLRIINFPARGIGAVSIVNLQSIADERQVSLFDACKISEGKSSKNLLKFVTLIENIKVNVVNLDLQDTMAYIIEASGLKAHYEEDKKSGVERLENLNELINAIAIYNKDGVNSVAEFLANAVLESSGDTQKPTLGSAVQLLTIHSAKGLEFDTVFIAGLEDGLFPHDNCLMENKELEEERRLMYVAITRARKKLYLLRACSRLMWGKRQSAPLSRFVNEIPSELINNISGISQIGSTDINGIEQDASNYNHGIAPKNPETKISRVSLLENDLTIKIGDTVKHAKFGNGKVLHLNIDGKKMTGDIFFIGLGKKTLDLNIAKIEKC